MVKINRRPGTQDISWFLDQHKHGRLNLDPPYQRRSVWTSRDRRYFLDTLFRGYPCPPIYLHKTIDDDGSALFHVVDGKQRIETIVRFAEGKVRIPQEYGDERLDNKRWRDIFDDAPLRNQFLNYAFVVEYFDDVDSSLVNEIFERMNKNSRKLTQQELRNARYDGWFSTEVEREVDEPIWRKVGIVTPGRARRMADVQFLAELFMIIIDNKIVGFDHALIDNAYAHYEDIENPDLNFDKENFATTLSNARAVLTKVYDADNSASGYLSGVANMYTLWAIIVLDSNRAVEDTQFVQKYLKFMSEVNAIAAEKRKSSLQEYVKEGGYLVEENEEAGQQIKFSAEALDYYEANQSATTEYPQRLRRLTALRKALNLEDR